MSTWEYPWKCTESRACGSYSLHTLFSPLPVIFLLLLPTSTHSKRKECTEGLRAQLQVTVVTFFLPILSVKREALKGKPGREGRSPCPWREAGGHSYPGSVGGAQGGLQLQEEENAKWADDDETIWGKFFLHSLKDLPADDLFTTKGNKKSSWRKNKIKQNIKEWDQFLWRLLTDVLKAQHRPGS